MKPDFFNDNVQRAYPLEATDVPVVPEFAIADFGSIVFAGADYDESQHRVWLDWVRRTRSKIEFCYRCSAPQLQTSALIFQFNITDPSFTTAFAYATPAVDSKLLGCRCTDYFYAADLTAEAEGMPDWEVTGSATTYQDSFGLHVESSSVTEGKLAYRDIDVPDNTRVQLLVEVTEFTGDGQSALFVRVVDVDETVELGAVTVRELGATTVTFDTGDLTTVRVYLHVLNTTYAQLAVVINSISLAECSTASSSFHQDPPDPGLCNEQSTWEGFMVIGDVPKLLEYMTTCDAVIIDSPAADVCQLLLLLDTGLAEFNDVRTAIDQALSAISDSLPQLHLSVSIAAYNDGLTGGSYDPSGLNDGVNFASYELVRDFLVTDLAATVGDSDRGISSLSTLLGDWTLRGGTLDDPRLVLWVGGSRSNALLGELQAVAADAAASATPVYAINVANASAGIDAFTSGTSNRQASTLTTTSRGAIIHRPSVTATDVTDFLIKSVLRQVTASDSGDALKAMLYGPGYVEPARIQNLSDAHVRTIAVGNVERTRASSRDGCRELCWSFEPEDVYTVCSCLVGDVDFVDGHNVSIQVSEATNAIIFNAGVGLGLGVACDELPISPIESPPAGRTTYTGSLRCSEVITQVNGNTSRKLLIVGGDGVQVTSIPEQHRIIIDANLADMAYAPIRDPDLAVMCHYPDEDICICGPESLDDFICPDPPPGRRSTTTTTQPPGTTTTTTTTTTTPAPTEFGSHYLGTAAVSAPGSSGTPFPVGLVYYWGWNGTPFIDEESTGLNLPRTTPATSMAAAATKYDFESGNRVVGGNPTSSRVDERWMLLNNGVKTTGRWPTQSNVDGDPVFRGTYVVPIPTVPAGATPRLTGMFQEVFLNVRNDWVVSFQVDRMEGRWYWYLYQLVSQVYIDGNNIPSSAFPHYNYLDQQYPWYEWHREPMDNATTPPQATAYNAAGWSATKELLNGDATYTINLASRTQPKNTLFRRNQNNSYVYGHYLLGFGPDPNIRVDDPPTARILEVRNISLSH